MENNMLVAGVVVVLLVLFLITFPCKCDNNEENFLPEENEKYVMVDMNNFENYSEQFVFVKSTDNNSYDAMVKMFTPSSSLTLSVKLLQDPVNPNKGPALLVPKDLPPRNDSPTFTWETFWHNLLIRSSNTPDNFLITTVSQLKILRNNMGKISL